MNALQNLFKRTNRDEEISKIVPLADCSHDCVSCTTKFPSSVKIEDIDMYNSAKPTACHFVVPTGKSDWIHEATSTPNTVENAVVQWIESKHSKGLFTTEGTIKCSTSSLPIDLMDPTCVNGERGDILIMPFFVWLRAVDAGSVCDVLTEVIPKLIAARANDSEPPTEALGYKLDKSPAHSYIFLCSHKTRDKRCGVTAPLMKREMDNRLRDTGHYRDVGDDSAGGVHVSFTNHLGGHKFAANVIVYLRTGEVLWLAKCTPANAKPIIDETVLGGGKVWGDLVRVVQKNKGIEW